LREKSRWINEFDAKLVDEEKWNHRERWKVLQYVPEKMVKTSLVWIEEGLTKCVDEQSYVSEELVVTSLECRVGTEANLVKYIGGVEVIYGKFCDLCWG
jgi:hypothetical protein